MAILSARAKMVREQTEAGQEEDSVRARSNSDQIFLVFKQIFSRLVCYGSRQAHSSVERAGLLAGVKMRLLETGKL